MILSFLNISAFSQNITLEVEINRSVCNYDSSEVMCTTTMINNGFFPLVVGKYATDVGMRENVNEVYLKITHDSNLYFAGYTEGRHMLNAKTLMLRKYSLNYTIWFKFLVPSDESPGGKVRNENFGDYNIQAIYIHKNGHDLFKHRYCQIPSRSA